MSNVIDRAIEFATLAHRGQVRRYTGEPYIVHPVEVMEIVSTVSDDSEVLAAALLHDTVEDTPISLQDIRYEFGDRVAGLVDQLTDRSRPEDGNRKARKEIDRVHLSTASPEAQTVKLADLISNTRSIVEHDPVFAKVYMREKLLLLDVLHRGNKLLFDRAMKLVEDYYEGR
jgi:(p)ppGpp synthase/HD superfamily hydrolase|tara:strand:- start:1159 stop:1674 length:516 start_codon:yes stop_codon:yes gene_type:complete